MSRDRLVEALSRRWWASLLALLVPFLIAVGYLQTTTKLYQSSTRVFVHTSSSSGGLQESLASVQVSQSLLASYAQIATSDATVSQMREQLGLAPQEPLGGTIASGIQPSTLLIVITATSPEPRRAQVLAATASDSFSKVLSTLTNDPSERPITRVIDRPRLPMSPSSPRTARTIEIALLAGLLLALVVVAALEWLDSSIQDADDARDVTGLNRLVDIPNARRLRRSPLVTLDPGNPLSEPFRTLRTRIRFQAKDEATPRTLLVTSAGAQDGKSLVAANLALTLAQSGDRVCLVDADLRRSGLSKIFQVHGGAGLSSVLTQEVALEEALLQRHALSILPSGARPTNPSELLGSTGFLMLLETLKAEYDSVVIDAPPVLPVTDAVTMAVHVDVVVLVVRRSRTKLAEAARAREALLGVGALLAGFVLNGTRGHTQTYY